MIKRKKIVRSIVKEYWEEICPLCGNSEQPIVQYSEDDFRLLVELKCSKCGLTVSFKK